MAAWKDYLIVVLAGDLFWLSYRGFTMDTYHNQAYNKIPVVEKGNPVFLNC